MPKKVIKESVWDYPRPPRAEVCSGHVHIIHDGSVIADSNKYIRILETSHPPTIYIPFASITGGTVSVNVHNSFCEFKGRASYIDIDLKTSQIKSAGWFYPSPNSMYLELLDHVALYASKFDECYLNDERVKSQEGDFYGGWITSNLKGPFKGGPGTWGW